MGKGGNDMAEKIIKFPLKMKNGALVRNLEDLRENADVDSIMRYYTDGKLKLWCKAYGLNDLADKLPDRDKAYIENILELFGIELHEEKIDKYVARNFGYNFEKSSYKVTADIDEKKAVDSEEIKEETKKLLGDESIDLDEYVIDVLPVWDEDRIDKYRVIITNDNEDQYFRFSLLNEEREDYSEELYKKDLILKIAYAVKEMINCVNENRNRSKSKKKKFGILKKGDIVEFGTYEGEPLKWRVINTSYDRIYVLCERILSVMQFDHQSKKWEESYLRKWLNEEFYKTAFDNDEMECIKEVNNDKITLLSDAEAEDFMTLDERKLGSSTWWLRSAFPCNPAHETNDVWFVFRDGSLDGIGASYTRGVRPALYIDY